MESSVACFTAHISQLAPLSAQPWLAPDEELRHSSFKHEPSRQQFMLGRLMLRAWLQQQFNDAQLSLSYQASGKPYLSSQPDWHFSLSHSGGWVLFATAPHPIGVDIEACDRGSDLASLVKRFFTQQEQQQWLALASESLQQHAFIRAWTYKEALVKGAEIPLQQALEQLSVPIVNDTEQGLHTVANPRQLKEDWQLIDLPAAKGYLAAMAVPQSKHLAKVPLVQDFFEVFFPAKNK